MIASPHDRANHARNLVRDATRAAGGIGRPQDWDHAIACLSEAADLGDAQAGAQRSAATVGIPAPCFEPTQVFHYAQGQEIGPHYDYLERGERMVEEDTGQPYDGQRIATLLIYLNDGFEGGETVFPKVGLSVRPAKGDALFFANVDLDGHPERMSLHAGLPVLSGEKWIVSQWIHNRPFTASL